ncbi:hypothetical protein JOQ06_001311, partial [Pogonophryne albipinna]
MADFCTRLLLFLPVTQIDEALEAIGEISHAENMEYSSDAQSSRPATATQTLLTNLEDKIENRDEICSICRFHRQFSTKCRYSSVLVMQVLDHMTGIPCLTRTPGFGSGPWTPRRAISGQSHRSTKPPRGLRRQPQQHQQHTLDN